MKIAGKIALSSAAVAAGAVGALGVAFFYVVALVIAPLLVLLLIGGLFVVPPDARSAMFWYALPWLLGFAVSVWLIVGAVAALIAVWLRRRPPAPPASAGLPGHGQNPNQNPSQGSG